MIIVLSGEGPSDLGIDKPGPVAFLLDQLIARRIGYSPIELQGSVRFVRKSELAAIAKERLAKIPLRGKKADNTSLPQGTRFFFQNARALANWIHANELSTHSIAFLFRDADGAASTPRREWAEKRDSVINGFKYEKYTLGVAVIPNPKSEAWFLCAIQNEYQNCQKIEETSSGNDQSPANLKAQLANSINGKYSLQSNTETLISLVREGSIDIEKISMKSLNLLKEDCHAAIDQFLSLSAREPCGAEASQDLGK
jgi:hypothetical protein